VSARLLRNPGACALSRRGTLLALRMLRQPVGAGSLGSVTDSHFEWKLAHEWTGDWFWEGLAFTLYLERPLTKAQEHELRRLILAWYEVGVWGGYGPVEGGKGLLHFLGSILVKNDEGEPRVEWWADMGSAPESAIGSLMLCLQNWSLENDVPLTKLVFGHHEGFTADAQ
jgi:hypothetical protein